MSRKLKYKIISCSSEENQFPVSSLLFPGSSGWQTKRFCTYPQQVTFQFYGVVHIDKIQLISDSRKISSQVDILYYLPFTGPSQSEDRFYKYGYMQFNKNQNSQVRQQKTIMVDIKCLYLRFLFHKPYLTKQNFFSQIGIQQIVVYGVDSKGSFAPVQSMPRQIGNQNSNYANEEDSYMYQRIMEVTALKDKAVSQQDFQLATYYKQVLSTIKGMGQELKKLQTQKRQAIQQQDYTKANDLKRSIEQHKKQVDMIISQNDQIQDRGEEYDQRNDQINNNQNLDDFQDNQFVDPSMNDMLQKSSLKASRGLDRSRHDSRSRVKLNKSIIKKGKVQEPDYDDRVIPALLNKKIKTEESQNLEQEQKKVELQAQQINGIYIQYATIMQEHFSQQIVKKFFSRHWQLKVQALNVIQSQINSKQNVQASFIKSLILAVKNSISQTNFQVSLGSLQVLQSALKKNTQSNALAKSNQLTNDLDGIIKETIKKLSDNNNKIKQEAQKVFSQMLNSALYGVQSCCIALTKNRQKEKVKLSSKQIITRLGQLQKIVQKFGSSHAAAFNIAVDYGSQQVKNPLGDVRNQATNLLSICKNIDPNKVQNKLQENPSALRNIQKQKQVKQKEKQKGTQKCGKATDRSKKKK